MATEYRREIGSQVWHFDRHCFHWPNRFDFLVLYDRPHDQQICDECIALTKHTDPLEILIDPDVAKHRD